MYKLGREALLKQHRPENIARRLARQPKSQKFSDFVLGAIDGCVTTFAIVSGAFGTGFSASVVLVLGFAGETLEKIVSIITASRELWIEIMLTEEYGLNRTSFNPVGSALVTFAVFVSVGAIPLLPFLLLDLEMKTQFFASATLAGLMFFLVGMLKSLVYSQRILRSGMGTFLLGGAAAFLAFLTGTSCGGCLVSKLFESNLLRHSRMAASH